MNIFLVIEKNIRQMAKGKGMPLIDLINSIDMTEPGFYKMLSSGSMKVKTLEKIAEVLDAPIESFFKIPGDYIVKVNEDSVNAAEPAYEYRYKEISEILQKRIANLEELVSDKQKIIELLSK